MLDLGIGKPRQELLPLAVGKDFHLLIDLLNLRGHDSSLISSRYANDGHIDDAPLVRSTTLKALVESYVHA